jgi:hypothetical protein
MADVPAEVEQQLASMTQGEWAAFSAKVRAPDTAEQLRTAVSQHVSGDRLDAVMRLVNPAAFVDDAGRIDATKVQQHLSTLFGTADGPTPKSGAGGRAEAARRFGGIQSEPAPAPVATVHAGRAVQVPGAVQAEISKRVGKREQ